MNQTLLDRVEFIRRRIAERRQFASSFRDKAETATTEEDRQNFREAAIKEDSYADGQQVAIDVILGR